MSNRGKLFVVATPIGNLQDISFRAVETLKKVNCIFAEDTRNSKKLINHYDIDTKLYSYHDHSSEKEIARLLDILKDHKDVALISDAGTPTISDPGYSLIRQCINEGIDVIPIPGASALTAAISASGLPSDAFAFIGLNINTPSKPSISNSVGFFLLVNLIFLDLKYFSKFSCNVVLSEFLIKRFRPFFSNLLPLTKFISFINPSNIMILY